MSKLSKRVCTTRGSVSTVATILRAVKQEVAQEVEQVVKQEADGGWTAEFQELRQQPFDQADYDRLHAWFFTPYDVHAGSRESRTCRGTLRSTPRVVRQRVRIAEWPRLQEHVERLIVMGAAQSHEALGQMRCLERYMQKALHVAIPRILRAAPVVSDGTEHEDDAVVDTIELLDASDEEEVVINVEAVILGPVPQQRVPTKTEPRTDGDPSDSRQ